MIRHILAALIGGALYRWRGSANKYKKYFPRPFNQIAFAFPYAVYTYFWYQEENFLTWICYAVGAAVLAVTTLAIVTGHGGWMDIGKWVKERSDETLEFLIKWFHGDVDERLYDYIGMALRGLVISLPAGLATLNVTVAATGLMCGPAYIIGHLMYDYSPKALKEKIDGDGKLELYPGIRYMPRHLDTATEIGEALTGVFLWLGLSIAAP